MVSPYRADSAVKDEPWSIKVLPCGIMTIRVKSGPVHTTIDLSKVVFMDYLSASDSRCGMDSLYVIFENERRSFSGKSVNFGGDTSWLMEIERAWIEWASKNFDLIQNNHGPIA